MQIPKRIKIGGKVYEVEITDKLWLGAANVSAEIIYTDLVIRICPMARGKMEADFIHEVCHGIADAMGYKDHNKREIDALAQLLYQVIQDNPEMFQPDRPEAEEVPNCSDR